jgi:hypothetical protein
LIEPGAKQNFSWQVTPKNVIENNFILTRIFLMSDDQYNPVPARTESCGVFVMNFLGLKGTAIILVMIITSLICLAFGSVLLNNFDTRLHNSSPRIDVGLYILAGILLLGMMADFLGWWILSGIIILLAILLTVVLVSHMLLSHS